jgi:isohexenylglutaconyl-CoA hydratase
MTNTDAVLVEDRDSVLYVTLNRPERRNALSAAVLERLEDVAAFVAKHPNEVRAVVLRGSEGVFCTGGDIKDFKAVFQEGGADHLAVAANNRRGGVAFTALDRLPTVLIAAVEGAAMGGGVGLAAVADITLATAGTRFSLSETTLGIPPAQISPFVTARVGPHHARALMLTAARINAQEAHRIGLVDRVVADSAALDEAVDDVLAQVRRCAPGANAASKALVHLTAITPLEDLLDVAASKFADAMLGDEGREGIRGFVGKSAPAWSAAKV